MNDPRLYIEQDAGVFMYAYLRGAIEYVKLIMDGRDDETQGQYRINKHTPKLVVNSIPFNVGKTTYQISISIHKDMQYIQVQLVDLHEKKNDVDSYNQLNDDLSTQYIELDWASIDRVGHRICTLYVDMRNSNTAGFVEDDIHNGHGTVNGVVTDILKSSLEYSIYAAEHGNRGYKLLDNGIGVNITQNQHGPNIKLHFGEILTRAVKLDSMFI